MAVLASVGVNAAKFTWTSDDGQYTVTASNVGDETQKLEVNKEGALAAFVKATKDLSDSEGGSLKGVGGNSQRVNLIVEGPMGADDFKAMNSSTVSRWGNFKNIDLSSATISGIGDMGDMNLSGLEYLRLPNGLTSAKDVQLMSTLKDGGKNNNLKIAGAVNSEDKTAYSLHSFSSNNVQNFLDIFFGGYNAVGAGEAPEKSMVRMSGNLGDKDLVGGNGTGGLNFGKVLAFDFTGATFDPYTIPKLSVSGYTDPEHPYARGKGDSAPNDPFAEPDIKGTMVLDGYETNALYFINGYEMFTSIILPTGNNDIPPQAFKDRTALTSISIPENYITIGHEAFLHSGITEVVIGKNVKTIEAGAFTNCTELQDVKFQPGLDDQIYGPSVFYNCQNIKHIVLPEGIKTLGAFMFSVSKEVESVRLPETLENIGTGCFWDSESLSSITLPSNVKKIGKRAFCLTSIKDIYLTVQDPEKLPMIFTLGSNFENGDQDASFGTNVINNNGSNGKEKKTHAEIASETWEEACLDFYYVNGTATLHYPETLAEKVREDISLRYAHTTSDGGKIPDRNTWVDGYSQERAWSDFALRTTVDNSGTIGTNGKGVWSTDGWAQFLLMGAYDPHTETIVHTKEYDDVWYTMCFPFDLTDEQLATAFNEGFNIVDFSGVEIKEAEETVDNKKTLILHFNTVGQTEYRDEDNNVYNKLEKDADGFNIFERNGDRYVHYLIAKAPGAKTYVKQGTKEPVCYIEGYLATAGHPYMVHPNTGTSPGQPKVACHFSGIKWIESTDDSKTTDEVRAELFEARKRMIDLGVEKKTDNYVQEAYEGYSGQTYTFKGNHKVYRDGWESDPEVADEPQFTIDFPEVPVQPTPVEPSTPEITEIPVQGENPRDDKTTYPDAFQTLYDTDWTDYYYDSNTGERYGNGQPNSATYGFILTIANWDANTFQWKVPLRSYFNTGDAAITEAQFNQAKAKAIAFKDALDDYNSYDAKLAAYNASKKEWDDYRAALSWNQEEEEAKYTAALKAYQDAWDQYVIDHAAWEQKMANYGILIPKNAYFLGRRRATDFPKYYREIADDSTPRTTGLWTQYTAIVMPNDAAVAGIEAELDGKKASANGFNMVIDENFTAEMVTPTQIKQIVAEAEENGEKVEYMKVVYNINGQVVREGDTSLEGLPKGIYIVNGKKYFVR